MVVSLPPFVSWVETLGRRQTHRWPWARQKRTPRLSRFGSTLHRCQRFGGSTRGNNFAWLHHFKRLLVRYDRRAEIHEAFLALGCYLVCFRRLRRSF
jgi:hypothetical protein